ncbi:MAG TPA: hypothetical protein VKB15_10320, partial [Xanthobacteraceae bacterium]|nr:hypothetical protein [Xanthobacteraceae bacterium]
MITNPPPTSWRNSACVGDRDELSALTGPPIVSAANGPQPYVSPGARASLANSVADFTASMRSGTMLVRCDGHENGPVQGAIFCIAAARNNSRLPRVVTASMRSRARVALSLDLAHHDTALWDHQQHLVLQLEGF